MKKKALIVDDNDFYAEELKLYFEKLNFDIDRAFNAKEGWKLYNNPKNQYSIIITDITMETQISGLCMLKKLKEKRNFGGMVIVASTGFDFPGILPISKIILSKIGVHWLIPKKDIRQKKIINLFPTKLSKNKVFQKEISFE